MKESLIAVAAMALTGATYAQVTVSGALGVSLQKSSEVATTRGTQGLQVTTGNVVFSATEDLGGGYKASISNDIKLRGRDTNVTAQDASVSLETPAGTFSAGAMEVGSLLTNAWAGAPASFADGPDGTVLDGYSNVDFASFSMPIGAASVGLTYMEVGAGDGGLPGSNSTYSASTGTAGNKTGISGYQLSAAYSAGAVSVSADYTMFMAAKGVDDLFDGHTRVRVAGTYDLGVAKIGLGFQSKNKGVAAQYAAGVSVPLGKTTFGLTYSAVAKQDAVIVTSGAGVAANDAKSATTVGVQYDLSKTTNVSAQYALYNGVGSVNGSAATNNNEYRIRLQKSF